MEIFSAISGITDVTYKGEKVNIIEFLAGDSTVNTIFWCIFILAIGLTCIFTIAALIKNIINSQRNVSTIVGKFFLALLGTMAMLTVLFLIILISNSLLVLVKIDLAPPNKDTDMGGYTVLDIVFGDADRADLIIEPFEITDDKTKQVIRGNRYFVRTVDEDGRVYECPVKPSRTSDRSMLQMLLAE